MILAPFNKIRPVFGLIAPDIEPNNVVLPEPLAPIIRTNSFSCTLRSRFFKTSLTHKLFVVAPLALSLMFLLASGFGLKLRAVGFSQQFALTFGTNVGLMTITGLMLSNAMISLGGGLFSQYQGFCDVSQGVGTLVTGLASVVIGEKVLPFKKAPYLIISCVIGSILYRVFISIALHSNLLGIKTQDLNLITGLIIVLVMLTRQKVKYA